MTDPFPPFFEISNLMKTHRIAAILVLLAGGGIVKADPHSTGSEPRELKMTTIAGVVESVSHAARPVEGAPGQWRMSNPANGLEARFTPEGMSMRVESKEGGVSARLVGWRTTGLGYGENLQKVEEGTVVADPDISPNRVEIHRVGLVEWFSNGPEGLEHGYTLPERPANAKANAKVPLRVEMRIEGDLVAEVSRDGSRVVLKNREGMESLRYDKLKVWDAKGREITARMSGGEGKLALEVDDAGAIYPLTIDPIFTQQSYLKASNTSEEALFGSSVAVDGDTLVVGAPGDGGSGAAYVFKLGASGWTEQAYLKASNAQTGNQFGRSVSISGDTLVVGAPGENGGGTGAGAAYVFVRNGNTWSQHAFLKASNVEAGDVFGAAVSISENTVMVGAPGEDDGGINAGAAYVFLRNGANWTQQAYLKALNAEADDQFGTSVSISGDSAAVGAPHEDGGSFGINGVVDNNKPNSGAAYVFLRTGSAWSQQAYVKASNPDNGDFFGRSVSLDGDTLAVGATHESSWAVDVNGDETLNGPPGTNGSASGAAYVFVRSGTSWSQQAYVKAQYPKEIDFFGWSISVDGNVLVVGAMNENSGAKGINGNGANYNAFYSGAAYMYLRNGVTWTREAYLKASNADAYDEFGKSVAVSGGTIVVGAHREDSAATGVGGDEDSNIAVGFDSGAAYVFLGEGDEFGVREFWGAGPELAANETGNLPAEQNGINATSAAWSYGYRDSFPGTSLVIFSPAQHQNDIGGNTGVDGWAPNAGVMVNKGSAPVVMNLNGETTIPVLPGQIILKPATGAFPVVRWTAPEAGTYNIAARWVDVANSGGNGAAAHVVINGREVFGQLSPYSEVEEPSYLGLNWENGFGAAMPPQSFPLAAGDTVDFVLGPNGNDTHDLTAFNAVICRAPGVTISAPATIMTGNPVNVMLALAPGAELLGAALRVDGEPVLTDTTAPFSFVLPSLTPGEHHLQVEAIGTNRVLGASNVVLVTVDAAPVPSSEESLSEGEGEVEESTATGSVYDCIVSGFWDQADIWKRRGDNAQGVPGPNDVAFLGRAVQVALRSNVTVGKIFCQGRIRGDDPANNRVLTVNEHFSIYGLVADLTVINPVGGLLTNVKGAAFFEDANIVNNGRMYLTNSLFATESELTSEGSLTVVNAPASGGPIRLTLDRATLNGIYTVGPGAGIRADRMVAAGAGNLISILGPGLIGNDGSTLVGQDGGTVIARDGASLVGNDGASLIGNDSAGLIGNDGSTVSLIGNDVAGLISDNGAVLVGNDGASLAQTAGAALISNSASASSPSDDGEVGEAQGDSGIYLTGGTLRGSGSLTGSIINSAAFIAPGSSPGVIWISGDFTQEEGGTLFFEIGGTNTDPLEFDQLFVTGSANLGGELIIDTLNGFASLPGDNLQPFIYGAREGSFSRVSSNAKIAFGPNGMTTEVDGPLSGGQPTISVSASNSRLKEGKSTSFTLSAPPGTLRPVTVAFAMRGKAKWGGDYMLSTKAKSIVIPVGRDSVSITIKTKKDKLAEKTETATMAILPAAAYTLSPRSSATVSILNVKSK